MGQDFSDISAMVLNTPSIIPMVFPLCEVVFLYSGIAQMCTPCPVSLSRRAGNISTPYSFSVMANNPLRSSDKCRVLPLQIRCTQKFSLVEPE